MTNAMRLRFAWLAIAVIALTVLLPDLGGAEEAAAPAQAGVGQQPKDLRKGDGHRPLRQGLTKRPQYYGNMDADNAAINEAWRDAGQLSPFNPKTTPGLRDRAKKAKSYDKAIRAVEYAIDKPDSSQAARSLWGAADDVARQTHGNIMEILHIIMVEAVRQDNETKRSILSKLERYNKIDRALADSLKKLADASHKLAARESKDESDAKARIDYWRYDRNITGSDGEPVKTVHIRKSVTRAQLGLEMKTIESDREELRHLKAKAHNEFQHIDQVVNQQMQGISRLMRTLGTLRTQTGLGDQKP